MAKKAKKIDEIRRIKKSREKLKKENRQFLALLYKSVGKELTS
jgi:hypothetical protein